MPMGICHTTGVVHAVDNQQTKEEALNSNQATYKPCDIFSAGPVDLLQEFDDGFGTAKQSGEKAGFLERVGIKST